MPKYKVLIPFEPVIFESVSQTHITELAESFSLSGTRTIFIGRSSRRTKNHRKSQTGF